MEGIEGKWVELPFWIFSHAAMAVCLTKYHDLEGGPDPNVHERD
jgi:hypothetical protein